MTLPGLHNVSPDVVNAEPTIGPNVFLDANLARQLVTIRPWMTVGPSGAVEEPPNVWDFFSGRRRAGVIEGISGLWSTSAPGESTHATLLGDPAQLDPFVAVQGISELVFEPVNVDPIATYSTARKTAQQSRQQALAEFRRRLDSRAAEYAQVPPSDVVTYLTEKLGVGQLMVARALGVSPTAVRKWRRGESARPDHRGQAAQFAALCDRLLDAGVHDPAGWLDIPISSDSTLTKVDLFSAGRGDLVLLFAARLADPQETLDAFNPEWRFSFAIDVDYEVVTLSDSSRAAVPRRKE